MSLRRRRKNREAAVRMEMARSHTFIGTEETRRQKEQKWTDPYARCEDECTADGTITKQGSCTHDLALGVEVEAMLAADGPYPAVWSESGFNGWIPAGMVATVS